MARIFQRGYLYRKRDTWRLRYSDNGVQRDRTLARVEQCRTKGEARRLADQFLAPFNGASSTIKLLDFVQGTYFPSAKQQLRASSYSGYRNLWSQHLEARVAGMKLGQFRTADGERLLQSIAEQQELSVTTLRHIKAFLSGVFRYAKRTGILLTENPMRDVAIPKARAAGETYAYSLPEILQMLQVLPEPASTIVAVAAFTGVRRGELRGLRWDDYDGKEIRVSRSYWREYVAEPKTAKSKAAVPVIPQLALRLTSHRELAGNPIRGPIFPAVDLDRMARTLIAPVLKAHRLTWHGWHAFRRGLATNLHHMGVQDKVIQRVLRHSNVSVTLACYIKPTDKDVEAAMEKFANQLG